MRDEKIKVNEKEKDEMNDKSFAVENDVVENPKQTKRLAPQEERLALALKPVQGQGQEQEQGQGQGNPHGHGLSAALSPWRHQMGRLLETVRDAIDANVAAFRFGCVAVAFATAAVGVKYTRLGRKFDCVMDIPDAFFERRRTLKGTLVKLDPKNPTIWYINHMPPLYRWLEKIGWSRHHSLGSDKLLCVRPLGAKYDPVATEWIYANFMSRHRLLHIKLLHRIYQDDEHAGSFAIATLSAREVILHTKFRIRNIAAEIIGRGMGTVDSSAKLLPLMNEDRKLLDMLEKLQDKTAAKKMSVWEAATSSSTLLFRKIRNWKKLKFP